MNLLIINAETGEILHNHKIFDVDFEKYINLGIHDNMIIATYYNIQVFLRYLFLQ